MDAFFIPNKLFNFEFCTNLTRRYSSHQSFPDGLCNLSFLKTKNNKNVRLKTSYLMYNLMPIILSSPSVTNRN